MVQAVRKKEGHRGHFNGSVGSGARHVPSMAPSASPAQGDAASGNRPAFDPEVAVREQDITGAFAEITTHGGTITGGQWVVVDEAGNLECAVAITEGHFQESPRDLDDENVFVMAHGRYRLPNETDIDFSDYGSWGEVRQALRRELGDDYVIVPVSATDHSGVSFNIGDPQDAWDSGRVGFIAVPATPGVDPEEVAERELKRYERWSNGDYRSVTIYDFDSGETESYTDFDGLVDEADPGSVGAFVASHLGDRSVDLRDAWHRHA